MKLLIIVMFAVGAVLANSSCRTVHGAGQDVKHVGQGIENASGVR
jgi:predicted small secreted protein